MADVTISSLPLGTPSGNGLIPFSQGGQTYSTALAQLSSLPFMPKAFGVFDGSNNLNTNCTILKQYNVSNIQKLGWSGLYRVTFAESITWPYVPILTGFNDGSGNGSWVSVGYFNPTYPDQGQNPTNTSFTIQAYTNSGSYQSQKYISFLVY